MSKGKQATLFQSWGQKKKEITSNEIVDLCDGLDEDDDEMLAEAMDRSMHDMEDDANHKEKDGGQSDICNISVGAESFSCSTQGLTQRNCPLGFDRVAGKLWIYPTNYPVRDYQYNIVSQSLLKNTMVTLPTGLGKTFIAAVVMYNFYRWYPRGKVVFMAPTKPLVAQQIEACYNIMGIPQEDTAEMTGTMAPTERQKVWNEKRVFFLTPQVIMNDLSRGTCPAVDVRCLVIDEAHKATGNHAYCQVVKELMKYTNDFRILALSATPGGDIKAVQQVLANLMISHIELRTEDSSDIKPYTHERKVDKIVVPLGDELTGVKKKYVQIMDVTVNRLKRANVLYKRDTTSLSKFLILKAREDFRQNPPPNLQRSNYGAIEGDFALAMSLYHGYELLQLHGSRSLYNFLDGILHGDKAYGRTRTELMRNPDFNDLIDMLREKFSPSEIRPSQAGKPLVTGHPKMEKLEQVVLDHFNTFNKGDGETRVMIFSQYRDSVSEITNILKQHQPLVKVMSFIGQSSAGKATKGFTQKEQLKVMKDFREGGYNTLVSTCVGEEGLDIGDVDLIVCFDAHKSPIRLVQRMGRTGRKREGRIVMLVTEGKEEQIYNQSQYSKKSVHKAILNSARTLHFYQNNPTMVPDGWQPNCHKMYITVSKKFKPAKGTSSSNQSKITSMLTSNENKGCGDGGITKEEYEELQNFYSGEPPSKKLPRGSSLLCLGENLQNETENYLSLTEWFPWQNRLQQSFIVDHSKQTKHFVEMVEFLELQEALDPNEDNYGQEMDVFLNEADILKEGQVDADCGNIKQFFAASEKKSKPTSKKRSLLKNRRSDQLPEFEPFVLSGESDDDLPAIFETKENRNDEIDGNPVNNSETVAAYSKHLKLDDKLQKDKSEKKTKHKRRNFSGNTSVVTVIADTDVNDFVENVGNLSIINENSQENVSNSIINKNGKENASVKEDCLKTKQTDELHIENDSCTFLPSYSLEPKNISQNEDQFNGQCDSFTKLLPNFFSLSSDEKPASKTSTNINFNLLAVPDAPSLKELDSLVDNLCDMTSLPQIDLGVLVAKWDKENNALTESTETVRTQNQHVKLISESMDDSTKMSRTITCDNTGKNLKSNALKKTLIDITMNMSSDFDSPIRPNCKDRIEKTSPNCDLSTDFSRLEENIGNDSSACLKRYSNSEKNSMIKSKFNQIFMDGKNMDFDSSIDFSQPGEKIGNNSITLIQSYSNTEKSPVTMTDTNKIYMEEKFMDFDSSIDFSQPGEKIESDSSTLIPNHSNSKKSTVTKTDTNQTYSGENEITDFNSYALQPRDKDDNIGNTGCHGTNDLDTKEAETNQISSEENKMEVDGFSGSDEDFMDTQANFMLENDDLLAGLNSDESNGDSNKAKEINQDTCNNDDISEKTKNETHSKEDTLEKTKIKEIVDKTPCVLQNTTNLCLSADTSLFDDSFVNSSVLDAVKTPFVDKKPRLSCPEERIPSPSQFTFTQALACVHDSNSMDQDSGRSDSGQPSKDDHDSGQKSRDDQDTGRSDSGQMSKDDQNSSTTDTEQISKSDNNFTKIKDPTIKNEGDNSFHVMKTSHDTFQHDIINNVTNNSEDFSDADEGENELPLFDLGFDIDDEIIPPSPCMSQSLSQKTALKNLSQSVLSSRKSLSFIGDKSKLIDAKNKSLGRTLLSPAIEEEDHKNENRDCMENLEADGTQGFGISQNSPTEIESQICTNKEEVIGNKHKFGNNTAYQDQTAGTFHNDSCIDLHDDFEMMPTSPVLSGKRMSSQKPVISPEQDSIRSPETSKLDCVVSTNISLDDSPELDNSFVVRKKRKKALIIDSPITPGNHDKEDFDDFKTPMRPASAKNKSKFSSTSSEEESILKRKKSVKMVSFCVDENEDDFEFDSFRGKNERHSHASLKNVKNSSENIKRKSKSPANPFLVGEAEVSEDEDISTDEEEGSDLENMEDSFVSEGCTQLSQGQHEELHAIYMKSVRSPAGQAGKFKLKYDYDENINVYSQVPQHEESQYYEDSFVDDEEDEHPLLDGHEITLLDKDNIIDNDSFVGPRTRWSKPTRNKTKSPVQKKTRRKRVKRIEDSSSEDENNQSDKQVIISPKDSVSPVELAKSQENDFSKISRNRRQLISSSEDEHDQNQESKSPSIMCSLKSRIVNKQKCVELSSNRNTISEASTSNITLNISIERQERIQRQKEKQEEFKRRMAAKQQMEMNSSNSASGNKLESLNLIDDCDLLLNTTRPLNNKIVIIVDSREINGAQDIVSALRFQHNMNVVAAQLDSCDYVVSTRMGIDRKQWSEFSNGSNRVKMIERVQEMSDFYEKPCLIIEKDKTKGDEKGQILHWTKYVDKTLVQLISSKLTLFFTQNQLETASIVADLCQLENRKNCAISSNVDLNTDKQNKVKFYRSIPRLSYVHCLFLCNSFKTVADFLRSDVKTIMTNGKMTEERAMDVHCYIRRIFDSQMLPSSYG